jgi:hypothetical protein
LEALFKGGQGSTSGCCAIEEKQQMKITSKKKLRIDEVRGMLATIQFRILCLPICYKKTWNVNIYRMIIVPAVLYECEALSLTLREQQRLRAFKKGLRKISGT